MERETGYYWVKIKHIAELKPAKWANNFFSIGTVLFREKDIEKVYPARIPTPDEKSVITPLYLKEAAREYSNKFDPRWRDESERDFTAGAKWMQNQSRQCEKKY